MQHLCANSCIVIGSGRQKHRCSEWRQHSFIHKIEINTNEVAPFYLSDNATLTKMFPVGCHSFTDINSIIKRIIYMEIRFLWYDNQTIASVWVFYFDMFAVHCHQIKVNIHVPVNK